MGAIIVIFILISGYFFVHNSTRDRFKAKREDAQRYYFRCGTAGFMFIGVGIILAFILDHYNYISAILNLTPYSIEYFLFTADKTFTVRDYLMVKIALGSSLALPISFFSAKAKNYVINKEEMYRSLRDDVFSDIERFLADSGDNYITILITLSNNKVYVGFVMDIRLEHKDVEYFSIMPMLSGYRDKEDLTVNFTTNYHNHYCNNINSDGTPKAEGAHLDDFVELIKVSEIIHMGKFHIANYRKFQSESNKNSSNSVLSAVNN
ncbi:hypothetical protein [uncultured Shewanella sp.]|uniref:hypothetical protein n=1 Tax=uncultured Shewanella sp. TaxID=173975 RepID=UPI00261CB54E|nr:hypothetical protein [uncultured Shewanella sp.]